MYKEAININDFAYLMLATLANNSKYKNLNNPSQKRILLPAGYKQNIQNILCAENKWKEIFSSLINIEEYFDDHFIWENSLSIALMDVLEALGKEVEYCLITDKLVIEFTQEEIDEILNQFPDEELKRNMDHFTNLLTDYIYTRQFQENFYDYSARSVSKMHTLHNVKEELPEVSFSKQKRIRFFGK